MRKFVLFVSIVVLIFLLLKSFVQSGRFEKYLDKHPNTELNSRIEYFWGVGLRLMGRGKPAEYRLRRAMERYPDREYGGYAWLQLIELYDDTGPISRVKEEIQKFLEKNPDSPESQRLKKRLDVILYGY